MNRKVKLLDYQNQPHYFTIKDYEKVKFLQLQIISGDSVLTLIYEDKTVVLDSCGVRFMEFYDGCWFLKPSALKIINKMKNHHDTEKLDEISL